MPFGRSTEVSQGAAGGTPATDTDNQWKVHPMKFSFLAGFAAGYVLGTKADPQRYEQIKAAAVKVKDNPTVQQTTHQVTETVKGKASEAVSRAKTSNGNSSTPGTAGEPSPVLAARTVDPLEAPILLDDDELGSPKNDPFNTRP